MFGKLLTISIYLMLGYSNLTLFIGINLILILKFAFDSVKSEVKEEEIEELPEYSEGILKRMQNLKQYQYD
jgi:hypothetical protein